MLALAKFIALLAALYGLMLGWLYVRQERLLFQPEVLPAAHRFSAAGPDVRELSIPVGGATLSALHLRLPRPRGVVFYLHGNAGSLQSWFVNADFYRRAGYDLFMIDYRGYGKSTGRIESEAQLRGDVRAAWDFALAQYGSTARGQPAEFRRVIYGRSLGSGLATGLAAEVQPDLTLLVSPYFSLRQLVSEHYPFVPSAWLLRYPVLSNQDLPRIAGPVVLIHGQADELIPAHHSEALLPLARRGRLALVPRAAHNDLQNFEAYLTALRGALAEGR